MASNTDQASLEQEVHSLQAYANEYSQQHELLTQQLRFLESARGEARASIETLEAFSGLEGDVPTLLNLGGGISVHATVTDTKNIMVGIGAGITVEKPVEEAITFLRDRITEMDASAKRLSESLGKLQEQMRAIDQRMQEIYSQTQLR